MGRCAREKNNKGQAKRQTINHIGIGIGSREKGVLIEKAMSSITSGASENTIKLDYLGSPVSHIVRPYSHVQNDSDTKSVGSKSVTSRSSKLTYSGKSL